MKSEINAASVGIKVPATDTFHMFSQESLLLIFLFLLLAALLYLQIKKSRHKLLVEKVLLCRSSVRSWVMAVASDMRHIVGGRKIIPDGPDFQEQILIEIREVNKRIDDIQEGLARLECRRTDVTHGNLDPDSVDALRGQIKKREEKIEKLERGLLFDNRVANLSAITSAYARSQQQLNSGVSPEKILSGVTLGMKIILEDNEIQEIYPEVGSIVEDVRLIDGQSKNKMKEMGGQKQAVVSKVITPAFAYRRPAGDLVVIYASRVEFEDVGGR